MKSYNSHTYMILAIILNLHQEDSQSIWSMSLRKRDSEAFEMKSSFLLSSQSICQDPEYFHCVCVCGGGWNYNYLVVI